MIVNFSTTDLNEMLEIHDMRVFSQTNGLENQERHLEVDQIKWHLSETRHKDFNIQENSLIVDKDSRITTKGEFFSFICLEVSLDGDVEYHYKNIKEQKTARIWKKGTANIVVSSGMDGCIRLKKGINHKMLEIIISPEYFRRIAFNYPELFEKSYDRFEKGEAFFISPKNLPVKLGQIVLFDDIIKAKNMGNLSRMYLEAKIQESLAMFMYNIEQYNNQEQMKSEKNDKERMIHASKILQENYFNPPTLHELALMIGTNECDLKSSFKKHFGTTVFGYLFDLRMNLAKQYLTDTNKTIQEIATLVGYEHQTHFATAFKRKYGKTPSECRFS